MADSTTAGYISQTTTDALGDDPLTNVLQELVVGLTTIPNTLVRPRWQPQPPTQPSPTTDWCAIGIVTYSGVDYPQYIQSTDLSGNLGRLERIDVLATFYGPNSASFAGIFRDGLYVQQNFQTLSLQGVKLRSADDITHAPEAINGQFVSRSDVPVSFMRMIDRTYPVATLTGAEVTFVTNTGLTCVETISQES